MSLLNRIDTKFLMAYSSLKDYLESLKENYSIVEIDGLRTLPYKTLYFDTENLHYYHLHHNGKLNRLKFRSREYANSGTVFNEVKKKDNKGRTKKSRIKRGYMLSYFDDGFKLFAEKKCKSIEPNLLPQLLVKYNRITLVDNNFTERITIDTDLEFSHNSATTSFEKLVIIEVKREKGNRYSPGQKSLKEIRCKETGFSKYCVGIATTHENIKKNNFKQKLQMVKKICEPRSN